MQLYFNELSVNDREKLAYSDIRELAGINRRAGLHDIKKCKIDNESYDKIFTMINEMQNSGNAKNFFWSFFCRPFEDENVLEREEDYYLHNWSFEGRDCLGLAFSFLMDGIALSLWSKDFDKAYVSILKDEELIEVRNISREEHIEDHVQWIESKKEIVLLKRMKAATEADIELRDDHGKNILMKFYHICIVILIYLKNLKVSMITKKY